MKYIKKPLPIDAVQLPKIDEPASEEVMDFLESMDCLWTCERDGAVLIHTLEGEMLASPGDYIIKGVAGEFYPCKPEIFKAAYYTEEEYAKKLEGKME